MILYYRKNVVIIYVRLNEKKIRFIRVCNCYINLLILGVRLILDFVLFYGFLDFSVKILLYVCLSNLMDFLYFWSCGNLLFILILWCNFFGYEILVIC